MNHRLTTEDRLARQTARRELARAEFKTILPMKQNITCGTADRAEEYLAGLKRDVERGVEYFWGRPDKPWRLKTAPVAGGFSSYHRGMRTKAV